MTKLKHYFSGQRARYLITLGIAVIAALSLGAVIMLITGHDPISSYGALFGGALGSLRSIGNVGAKAVTLTMTGLAMAVAAQAGMFNVGGEGQLFMGAMASAIVGVWLKGLPAFIVIPCAILAAILAGGAFAYVPARLKTRLGVNEVITTIMLNSVAILFCSFLANGPLKTDESGIAAGTQQLDPVYRFTKLVPLSNVTTSIFIAAAIAFVIWYLMRRSVQGYEMKMTGQNKQFALFMGMPTEKHAEVSMIISGALCGIVGMFEVYGIHGRFIETVSNEFYFDGMLVAMIMRYQPVGIMLMSIFFAILNIGSAAMEARVGVSKELIFIVQSIIIFFMAAEPGITASINKKRVEISARKKIHEKKDKGGECDA